MLEHVLSTRNCCESVQTTADILHKLANSNSLRALPNLQKVDVWYSDHGAQFSVWYSFKAQLWVESDRTWWLQFPSDARVCHWRAHSYFGFHIHNDTQGITHGRILMCRTHPVAGSTLCKDNMTMNNYSRIILVCSCPLFPMQPLPSQPSSAHALNYTLSSHSVESFGMDQKSSE